MCIFEKVASVGPEGKWASKLEARAYKMNLFKGSLLRANRELENVTGISDSMFVYVCKNIKTVKQWAWKERLCVYLFTISLRSCNLFDRHL